MQILYSADILQNTLTSAKSSQTDKKSLVASASCLLKEPQEREENLGCMESNAFVTKKTLTHIYSFNLKRKHISTWYIIYPGDIYLGE